MGWHLLSEDDGSYSPEAANLLQDQKKSVNILSLIKFNSKT